MSRQVNLGQIVPNIQIGETTTLPSGQNADVKNVGTGLNPILNFSIPKGDIGPQGEQGPQGIQGEQGVAGPQGEAFTIKKTYPSIQAMNADFGNMQVGDYVMIASDVEQQDNSKLYTRGEVRWIFITDFSGATGIQGEQGPQGIQGIQGPQGETGPTGPQGPTGNGIASITKTSTSGLVDTYTITYTNGTTTTFQITNGEDGEVTQAQLDETNRAIDYYKTTLNALPKVEGEGTSLTLDDTAEAPMKMSLGANMEQASTTGSNLFNLEAASIGSSYGTKQDGGFVIISGFSNGRNIGKLKNLCPKLTVGDNFKFDFITNATRNSTIVTYIYLSEYGSSIVKNISYSCTQEMLDSNVLFYGQPDEYYKNIQFYIGDTVPTYEPYTNGASPNPDYPQEIHTISGDNEIKVGNRNLMDINVLFQEMYDEAPSSYKPTREIINNVQCINFYNNVYRSSKFYCINYKENTQYTFRFMARVFNTTYTSERDLYFRVYYKDGTRSSVNKQANGNVWMEFKIVSIADKTVDYIAFSYGSGASWLIDENSFNIIEGDTTNYVEHQEQSLPLNLPVENLFDKDNVTSYDAFISSNGSWRTANDGSFSYRVAVKPNETYTISANNPEEIIFRAGWTSSENVPMAGSNDIQLYNVFRYDNTNKPITITTGNEAKYIVIQTTSSRFNITKQSLQVEPGDKANSYTPYGTPALEYSNIGDYEDEFVYNTTDTSLELNKWYLKKNVVKLILDETLNYEKKGNSFKVPNNVVSNIIKPSGDKAANVVTNYLLPVKWDVAWGKYESLISMIANNVRIKISNENITIEEFKNWVSNHNIILYGQAVTPEYILVNDTLQSQLTEIYKWVKAYQDQTNISQVNNDLPFVIKASAVRDMSNIFELITGTEL